MRRSLARSILLVSMAICAGLALGAVTKFGFGYDLPARAANVASGAP